MTRRIVRGTGALFALVAMVGIVPYVLARWGTWPISGLPTGQQLRDLPTTALTDTTIFAVLTVAAWVVWALFCASVVLEVGAVIRGIEAPHLPASGALQLGARHLVAALLMTVAAYRPLPAYATAGLYTMTITLTDKQELKLQVDKAKDANGRISLTLNPPGMDAVTYACACDKFFPVVTPHRTAAGETLIIAVMAKPCTAKK